MMTSSVPSWVTQDDRLPTAYMLRIRSCLAFARSWVTGAGDSALHYDSRINGVSQMPMGHEPANSKWTAVRKLWGAMVAAGTPAPHLSSQP